MSEVSIQRQPMYQLSIAASAAVDHAQRALSAADEDALTVDQRECLAQHFYETLNAATVAAREPLEARVRELERQLADVLEGALQQETFDPQAVRELLDADHAYRECTTTVVRDDAAAEASWRRLRLAVQRVRESEKK